MSSLRNRETKVYDHTSAGLREALFDELADLRNGVTTPHYATAVSKIATNILHSVELDMKQSMIEEARERNRLLALTAPTTPQLTDQSDEEADADEDEAGNVSDMQSGCELEAEVSAA